jgi:hypothetical protein
MTVVVVVAEPDFDAFDTDSSSDEQAPYYRRVSTAVRPAPASPVAEVTHQEVSMHGCVDAGCVNFVDGSVSVGVFRLDPLTPSVLTRRPRQYVTSGEHCHQRMGACIDNPT